MAKTFKYANESILEGENQNMPPQLKGSKQVSDDMLNSKGIYSRKDINDARWNRFSRFGRVLDPYGKLNPCREYLFFVKPDLHICVPSGKSTSDSIYKISGASSNATYKRNGLTLNPQLTNNPYFKDIIASHPGVIKELQYSVNPSEPFSHLLSFTCSSFLPLDSSEASTLDNPATIFGTSYDYIKDSEASDEKYSFQLEFVDDSYLNTYHFFKGYSEYHIARKTGLVTPPSMNYYKYKRLHNTMGIYKFIVAEDMETIIYWAYLWGVYPKSCPRDAFQDPTFSDGLTFSVSFDAAFIEDMNPTILEQFNKLMKPVITNHGCSTSKYLPIINPNTNDLEGKLPIGALVDSARINNEPRLKYRLRWYAP